MHRFFLFAYNFTQCSSTEILNICMWDKEILEFHFAFRGLLRSYFVAFRLPMNVLRWLWDLGFGRVCGVPISICTCFFPRHVLQMVFELMYHMLGITYNYARVSVYTLFWVLKNNWEVGSWTMSNKNEENVGTQGVNLRFCFPKMLHWLVYFSVKMNIFYWRQFLCKLQVQEPTSQLFYWIFILFFFLRKYVQVWC
jgi:hypothetical protein